MSICQNCDGSKVKIVVVAICLAGTYTKFFTGIKNDVPLALLLLKFTSNKIHDDGGRHFEIGLNGHNLFMIAHVLTRFTVFLKD